MTRGMLNLIQTSFIPNKVLIRIDPNYPPKALAELNDTVKALLEEKEPALRICEGGTCGMPIKDLELARKALNLEKVP